MVAPSSDPEYISEAEYLAFERESDIKHEYVNGRIYAMTGASWKHNVINASIVTTLNSQLANKNYIAVSNDMRLKVESDKVSFRYPDTLVICGKPDLLDNRNDTVLNPTVVIEVLSPSTALKDHNEKLDEYLKIETVQDYVIVSQHELKIEVYTRQNDAKWIYAPVRGVESSISLESIECTLSLADIYAKVDFDSDKS